MTDYLIANKDEEYSTAALLFKEYGFYERPAYYHNLNKTAVYFEIKC